jgi:hypothetical protein
MTDCNYTALNSAPAEYVFLLVSYFARYQARGLTDLRGVTGQLRAGRRSCGFRGSRDGQVGACSGWRHCATFTGDAGAELLALQFLAVLDVLRRFVERMEADALAGTDADMA